MIIATITGGFLVARRPKTPPPLATNPYPDAMNQIRDVWIEINDNTIKPSSAQARPMDQIRFANRSVASTITIIGSAWGNIPIESGQNMTQVFTKAGKYPYTITPLGLTGEVVISD